MSVSENVTATLRAQEHGHPPLVCYQPRSLMDENWGECSIVGALRNGKTGCGGAIVVSAAFDGSMGAKAGNIGYEEEKSPTLKAGGVYEVVIRYEDREEPVLP